MLSESKENPVYPVPLFPFVGLLLRDNGNSPNADKGSVHVAHILLRLGQKASYHEQEVVERIIKKLYFIGG